MASMLKLRTWHTDITTYSPPGCKKKQKTEDTNLKIRLQKLINFKFTNTRKKQQQQKTMYIFKIFCLFYMYILYIL